MPTLPNGWLVAHSSSRSAPVGRFESFSIFATRNCTVLPLTMASTFLTPFLFANVTPNALAGSAASSMTADNRVDTKIDAFTRLPLPALAVPPVYAARAAHESRARAAQVFP